MYPNFIFGILLLFCFYEIYFFFTIPHGQKFKLCYARDNLQTKYNGSRLIF